MSLNYFYSRLDYTTKATTYYDQTHFQNQDAHQINPSEVKASEPEAIENPSN